jgi:hypothetical protein
MKNYRTARTDCVGDAKLVRSEEKSASEARPIGIGSKHHDFVAESATIDSISFDVTESNEDRSSIDGLLRYIWRKYGGNIAALYMAETP